MGRFCIIISQTSLQKKKWEYNYKLKVINDSLLPDYLVKNRLNFNEWFK